MNTRCYRCGWSFSLSRETLEAAAIGSAGQKAHVIHCPRCRQAISIPMDQIMRALPPGWTAETATSQAAPGGAEAAGEASGETGAETTSPAGAEAVSDQAAAAEPASTGTRPQRRHRHSGKTNIGDSAAVPATKNSTHPN